LQRLLADATPLRVVELPMPAAAIHTTDFVLGLALHCLTSQEPS
jgi:hypothetical protein